MAFMRFLLNILKHNFPTCDLLVLCRWVTYMNQSINIRLYMNTKALITLATAEESSELFDALFSAPPTGGATSLAGFAIVFDAALMAAAPKHQKDCLTLANSNSLTSAIITAV